MNVARDLLDDLAVIGATVEPAGLVREEQEPVGTSADQQFKHRTLEACIVEWLNQHPAPSPPDEG